MMTLLYSSLAKEIKMISYINAYVVVREVTVIAVVNSYRYIILDDLQTRNVQLQNFQS